MKPLFPIAPAIFAALALMACDSREVQLKKDFQPSPTPALRDETKKLEGAAAIGIDSKQLRRSVDKILDGNDERNRQLKEAAKQVGEQ